MRWAPGARVLHRNVVGGRVWFAAPTRVVADDGAKTVTWLAPGTICQAADIGGRRANVVRTLAAGSWGWRDHRWFGWGQLLVWPRDCSHTVWPFRDPESGELLEWYINLQAPVTRGEATLDTADLFLDLVIDADLGARRWKDESEAADAVAAGLLHEADVGRLRAEGERLADRLGEFVEWAAWEPEPSWEPLALPPTWSDVDPEATPG